MKHKIKTRLVAVLVTAISIFCIAIPASAAWIGIGAGDVNGARFTYDNTPYGYFTGSDQFAWRVNLYISANEDGKINKDRDTVGSTYLPLVGSLLCVSPTYGTEARTTYIQTNYTNETRYDFNKDGGCLVEDSEGNLSGVQYTLPTLMEFDPGRDGVRKTTLYKNLRG